MADVVVSTRTYLLTKTAITDIVGQRIYADKLPQKATLPALVLKIQSERYDHALDGLSGIVATRIQVECYADTRLTSNALADAVIWCGIDQIKGTYTDINIRGVMVEDGRRSYEDDETGGGDDARYVSQFDFQVHWLKGI